MDVSALTASASDAQLGTVQSAVQLDVLKQAMDMQAQQVQQLLQAVPTPGQPGGVINTYA